MYLNKNNIKISNNFIGILYIDIGREWIYCYELLCNYSLNLH